jgi:hypothetical protein
MTFKAISQDIDRDEATSMTAPVYDADDAEMPIVGEAEENDRAIAEVRLPGDDGDPVRISARWGRSRC